MKSLSSNLVIALSFLLYGVNSFGQTSTPPSSGSGTSGNPYQISSLENLYWITQNSIEWDKHYIQTSDISALETKYWDSGDGFQPIGSWGTKFTGSYNGDGYSIDGLSIIRIFDDYQGLFGYTNNATIKNINLTNADIKGNNYVGIVVGSNSGGSIINNCSVSGNVQGNMALGGITGTNGSSSIIKNCTNTARIQGVSEMGGICGQNYATIDTCNSSGVVFSGSGDNIGGLVGLSNGASAIINSCYCEASVKGNDYVGGLVGYNTNGASILGSFSICDAFGYDYIGGLVGYNYNSSIEECFSKGTADGGNSTGGLIGYNYLGTILNCFSNCDALTSSVVGGLIGANYSSSIEKCYATGLVTGTSFGGLVGLNSSSTITDCFWDTETSGVATTSGGGTGYVTVGMEQQSVYTNWDFTNTWEILEGHDYPRLKVFMPEAIAPAGSGTGVAPYIIASLENLYWLSKNTTAWNKVFSQSADIDASISLSWAGGFTPIGNSSTAFSGNYYGNSHTISGLYIRRRYTNEVGLFGRVNNAYIGDLGLIDLNIMGLSYVGGLIGFSNSSSVGGVVNCYTTGTVQGNNGDQIGGLIGYAAKVSLNNCYSKCNVTGDDYCGGLVGFYFGTNINFCYSTGQVSGDSDVGGLIGYTLSGNVNNCFWDTQTSGQDTSSGGTGKTTVEMTDVATFTDLTTTGLSSAWDFVGNPNDDANNSNYWDIEATLNDGYPHFSWQTFCEAPSWAVLSATFGASTETTINWASHFAFDGTDGFAIYINSSSTFAPPANGDIPIADLSWNNSGQQCIYFGSSKTPNITITGLTSNTTYYFIIYSYNNCSGTTIYETTGLQKTKNTIILPIITQQPQEAKICNGYDTSFSVASTNTTGWQWQEDDLGGGGFTNVSNGGVYSGATTSKLSFVAASSSMNGFLYRCIISNSTTSDTTIEVSLTVEDLNDPVITSTHNDVVMSANVDCEAILDNYTSFVVASDNCDDSLTITQSPTAGTTITGATNTITLTATDDAGNTDQITFNVAVEDISNPVITSTHNDVVVLADADCEATLANYTTSVVATDNCDSSLTITQSPIAGTTISGTTNTITLTATDDAGNTDQVSFNVAVEDNADPVISSTHNDLTISANADCEAILPDYTSSVVASDNCDDSLTITQSPTAGTTITGVTNTITLTASDDAGNTDQITFNMAVEDISNPVITSTHNDVVVLADADCEATLANYTTSVVATDNCDSSLTITQSPIAGTTISGTTNTITLTATDDAGNTDQVSFVVAVNEITKPEILSSHNDTIVFAEENCEVAIPDYSIGLSATDNCDTSLLVTQNPIAGTLISGSTNPVTLTVTDDAGNTDEITFNVAVEDSAKPIIICVEDTTINLMTGHNNYSVSGIEFDPDSTYDNCGITNITNDYNNDTTLNGAILQPGNTTITWTATDNSGNSNSCVFTITVNEPTGMQLITENNIHIYPNPTTGHVFLKHENENIRMIEISDMLGKVLYRSTTVQLQIEMIDLSDFANGVYFIIVYSDYQKTTWMVVKR